MTPYIMIFPVLLFLLIVYGYPLLLTFKYSFQEVSLIGNSNTFVGLNNYKAVLTDSKFLWHTTINSEMDRFNRRLEDWHRFYDGSSLK